jgi:hypothetical protein
MHTNFLAGTSEGKGPLQIPGHRREYIIKMGLKGVGWEGVEWIHLASDRDKWQALLKIVINL